MPLPKLTREQLLDRCDLAGVARVVSVGRESVHSPPVAKLTFVRVVKGSQREQAGYVHVRLHRGAADHEGGSNLASWSDRDDYLVGAMVMTFLDWNGADEVYQTTWPGAVRAVNLSVARVA